MQCTELDTKKMTSERTQGATLWATITEAKSERKAKA